MNRKSTLSCLLLIFLAVSCAQPTSPDNSKNEVKIGDFAPIAVGEKWVYSYNFHSSSMGIYEGWDSSFATIQISSMEFNGKDSLATLNVSQNRFIYRTQNGQPTTDSSYSESFGDTVFFNKDSIWHSAGYRCLVFPFYKYHLITADSLHARVINNQTVYCFNEGDSSTNNYTVHIQNTGLYYHSMFSIGGAGHVSFGSKTQLLSHNDTSYQLPAKQPSPSHPSIARYQPTKPIVVINHNPDLKPSPLYNLNARKSGNSLRISNGMFIQKR